MGKAVEAEEVIPSARRLIKSLRDVGYDFPIAVADIIDNSIEWGATKVDVTVTFNGGNSWVRIADNGKGMDSAHMIEAMRFGSNRTYTKDALGKFGLGLKTSSLSQCRFLGVASRNVAKGEIEGYSWDLDYIEKTDKWEILKITDKQIQNIVFEPLNKNNETGTVVFWWKLDRILGYKHQYSEAAETRVLKMCRDLEAHLAMVFHKFLSGDMPDREKVEISINGNPIKPWDPFVRKEATTALQQRSLTLEYEGTSGDILVEPYVLPSQAEFSTMEKFNAAAGPAGWNHQQGFYIYRAGRLIQSGGWCRLRTQDEHTKLARIAVSFSPSLDDAFKLNIAKMQVQLPNIQPDYFESIVKEVTKLARDRYDKKERKGSSSNSSSSRTSSSRSSSTDLSSTPVSESEQASQLLFTLDTVEREILTVAKPFEKPMLKKIFGRLRKKMGIK